MHITLQIITAKSPAKEQDFQTVLACCMYELIFDDPYLLTVTSRKVAGMLVIPLTGDRFWL